MNVDFCDGMYGGIRRLLPMMTDTDDRGDLRRIAMSERNNSGKPVWRFPETWKINPKRGYWKRTVVPLLESEYKGFGLKMDTQRYVNPGDAKSTRTGAEMEDESTEVTTIPTGISNSTASLYPAGKRLSRGEATKARFHSPQDERGKTFVGIAMRIPVVFGALRA